MSDKTETKPTKQPDVSEVDMSRLVLLAEMNQDSWDDVYDSAPHVYKAEYARALALVRELHKQNK